MIGDIITLYEREAVIGGNGVGVRRVRIMEHIESEVYLLKTWLIVGPIIGLFAGFLVGSIYVFYLWHQSLGG